ncbi:flagellar biosynthetic protein FliQ [Sphingomonas sp. 37zxx]|uniref:flagellar biosynthetic protein FliQ n=1 Tax=Sphingomonas sp. 37zxx TaxID=1550073 RepID=UPI00053C05FE|nr:flagellar biosynthetic protein FliQ [Sphingomonas sp. 37zxx]
MDSFVAIELAKAAMILVLTIVGPMLITSLVVGVVIGLFQALTQVQEMTLTFVPKLMAIGLVMLLCLPMIGTALSNFMGLITDHIVRG